MLKSVLKSPVTTVALLSALWVSGVAMLDTLTHFRLPGNQKGYEPVQPIAFSHRLHAGEMNIACQYCHSGADESPHAGIPGAQTCMNCHSFVQASFVDVKHEETKAEKEGRKPKTVVSPEIRKIYRALGLNDQRKPDEKLKPTPIEWIRVHNLPDFVYFDHRPHITAGVKCQSCHGAIENMERVRQVETLSMGWCLDCHQSKDDFMVGGKPVQPTSDCAACHY